MPKRTLRSRLLAQRRGISKDELASSSCAAQLNLLSLSEFEAAACVALYAPIHNETDTSQLLSAAFSAGKRVLYPAVCGHRMVFRVVERFEHLQEGTFGVLEPCSSGSDHSADEADLIVVPGVAFDLTGHRLGYGKGFYDRFLEYAERRSLLVGLCHDFQLVDEVIPSDHHDIPMDIVVTDARVVRVPRAHSRK